MIFYHYSRFSNVNGDEFLSHAGSSSGGYLHHVFTYAAKHLFGQEVKELTYKTLKWVELMQNSFTVKVILNITPSGTDLVLFSVLTASVVFSLYPLLQEQGFPGSDSGERWGCAAVFCIHIWFSQHPESGAKVQEGKVSLPLCGSNGLSIG